MPERFVDVGSVVNFIAEQENKATLQKSTYEINTLQHGKCSVQFLFTHCFVSENSLVRFLILLNS